MSASLMNLIQTIVSVVVEAGGYSAAHGGKGLVKAGAERIGWAQKQEEKKGRLAGHSVKGHAMSTGFAARRDLHAYNPKNDYKQRTREAYARAQKSGSGLIKPTPKPERPHHLFGRSNFQSPDGPLGSYGSRWVRVSRGRGSPTPKPRSFIRF